MSRYSCILVIGFTLIIATFNFGGQPSENPSKALSTYMEAISKLGHFSGSVLVAQEGNVLLHTAYGISDLENNARNSPETKYRISSLTKSFTASAILHLEKQGRLKLDNPLATYFPNGPSAWREVTLEHLLTHKSGISNYRTLLGKVNTADYESFRAKPGNLKKLLNAALLSHLEFKPGSKFQYSNTGYLLLSHIVEIVSGQTFNDFVDTVFLTPHGLTNTGEDHHDLIVEKRAQGYRLKPGWTFKEFLAGFSPENGMLVPAPKVVMESPNGAGGFFSTANDLYQWIQIQAKLNKSEPKYKNIFKPGLGNYGYGWFITERFGQQRIWHTGISQGFNAILEYYPNKEITIILLGNTEQSSSQIAKNLAAILLGKPYTKPQPHHLVEMDVSRLKPLHGNYRRDDGRLYRVYQDGDMLVMEHADQFIAGMLPKSEKSFFVPMFRGSVLFEFDKRGNPISLMAQIHGKEINMTKEKTH